MDVFNHGQWNFQFGNYSIEFGLPSASASQAATTLGQPDPKNIESIGTFDSLGSSLKVLFDCNTRGSRRVRNRAEDVFAVAALLDEQSKTMVEGRIPTDVPFFGTFFRPHPVTAAPAIPTLPNPVSGPAVCPRCGEEYTEMYSRIHGMFSGPGPSGVQPCDFMARDPSGTSHHVTPAAGSKPFKFGYIDVRTFIGASTFRPSTFAGISAAGWQLF